jgi:hypothetical protein
MGKGKDGSQGSHYNNVMTFYSIWNTSLEDLGAHRGEDELDLQLKTKHGKHDVNEQGW